MKSGALHIISREQAAEIVLQIIPAEVPPVPLEPEFANLRQVTDKWEYPLWNVTGPAWYVIVPWNDGLDGRCLRSSRVIVIAKVGGAVLYDGSGNDEG